MTANGARVTLVTGATDGLGRALATELARRGVTVLAHGRDEARGRDVIGRIESETGNRDLRWYGADLASLAEVRELGRSRPAGGGPPRREHPAGRRRADGEPGRVRAPVRGQLPRPLRARATADSADRALGAIADRQRELGGTKIVTHAGINPRVTGRYFDGTTESRAHAQASDADARRSLRELSESLVGL